jgi:hypothetical protein
MGPREELEEGGSAVVVEMVERVGLEGVNARIGDAARG